MSPASAARNTALASLLVFAGLRWAQQVEPGASGALLAMVAVALLGAFSMRALATATAGRGRAAALAGAGVTTLGCIVIAAGVDARLLLPGDWDVLGAGLAGGLESLPGLRIPYRGGDEWTRAVVLAGGGLLALAAAMLVIVPRRPRVVAAAIVLAALYGIPVVERQPASPYLDGAVVALLLIALLSAGRVRREDSAVAAALSVAAACAALVVAPAVDAQRPWLDYERLAERLEGDRTSAFSWDHRYGPLYWPRDGREVLRVRARTGSYWKATALETFDGVRWRRSPSGGRHDDTAPGDLRRAWRQSLRVTVRSLRSREYVGAGTTLDIQDSPRAVRRATPGTFTTARRPLRRGDTYRALVYAPRPAAQQLRDAGSDYPQAVRRHLALGLPFDPRDQVQADNGVLVQEAPVVGFPSYDDDGPALARYQHDFVSATGVKEILRSPYARSYRLAQQIKAASANPYEFARAVQRRVRDGARYSETVPRTQFPLDTFLFADRRGYCQQFSGAMALLLRMGGLPARVATGFSPGALDDDRAEWVVRDRDAHSWVEAYFPGAGWVVFDPTPAGAPARSQATDEALQGAGAAATPEGRDGPGGDRGDDPLGAGEAAAQPGRSLWPWVAAALVVLLAGLVALRRRRRRPASVAPAHELRELTRALARSGRAPVPGLTLARIEAGLGDGAEYVRALRMARFGPGAPPPTAAQRRALRRDLVAGLGPFARLRGLWALPPARPGR